MHGMLCPICQTDLQPTDRQGIEIDFCPKCRGVWLDRGELDKIIERASPAIGEADRRPERYEERRPERYEDRRPVRYEDDDDRHEHDPRYRRKRKGLLSELFDFD